MARNFAEDEDICLTTNDIDVVEAAEGAGYTVPFLRPHDLAADNTGMREVMLHAIEFYRSHGKIYDRLVLLQPTSPFRQAEHVQAALDAYSDDLDMVVSVCESKANPYYVLFEEDSEGFLVKSKTGNYTTRQEAPKVWQLNGAVYVFNINSLESKSTADFTKIRKIVMEQIYSIDLDTELDWKYALLLNSEYQLLKEF